MLVTVYMAQTVKMQLNWMERSLIHPVLFLRPQLSQGAGQSVTLVDRVDVKNLDLQGKSTRLTRELFKKTDSGAPPKSSELGPLLPRFPQLFCACQVPGSGCPGLDSGPTSK